jgi:palmitoyltransferase ZDHHC9/14/18
LGYHLFLVGRGETTREYINSHKFMKKDRHRPFTLGSVWKNLFVVLLRPRTPTYVHFKQPYVEGDQRFSDIRGRKQREIVKKSQLEFPTERGGPGVEMADINKDGRGGLNFQGPSRIRDRTPRAGLDR